MDLASRINFESAFFIFSMSLIISIALTYSIQFVAEKFNFLSKIDFRRKGKKQVALLGGIAIYLSTLIVNLITDNHFVFAILLSAFPIIIIGIIDDKKELSYKPKFIAQIIAATIFINYLPKENLVIASWVVPSIFKYLLIYFWFITVSNAINFIDGIDGQASIVSLIIIASLSVFSSALNSPTAIISGAIIGFLFFNLPPAKIYLGESGSSFLGFIIAAFTLSIPVNNNSILTILAVLFLLSYPLVDLTYATIRRLRKRQSPFKGDRDHIHHKLQKIGFTRQQVLIITTTICIITAITSLVIYNETHLLHGVLITLSSAASLTVLLLSFIYAEHKLGTQISQYGRSLINKHIMTSDTFYNFDSLDTGVIIDLLPYYKELQYMGFPVVDSFVSDLAKLLNNLESENDKMTLGSYTLAISFYNNPNEVDKLTDDFRNLIQQYQVQKSTSEVPDGFYIYREHSKNTFIKLLTKNIEESQKLKEAS